MSGKKGAANNNDGGVDPEGFTLGRGSIDARMGGYGPSGGAAVL